MELIIQLSNESFFEVISPLRARGVGPFRKVVFESLSHHKVHVGSWHITERQIHCHSSPLEFRY